MNNTTLDLMKSYYESEDKGMDRLKKFENILRYTFELVASGVSILRIMAFLEAHGKPCESRVEWSKIHLKFDQFEKFYGSLSLMREKPSLPVKLYSILKKSIQNNCLKGLEEMMAEAELSEKFLELSQILEKNAPFVGEIAWRPTGNVADDLRSYTMTEKLKLVHEFEKTVLKKEAEVSVLQSDVDLCREKAYALNSTINFLQDSCETKISEDSRKIKLFNRLLNEEEKS